MVPIPEGSETHSEESSGSTTYGSTQEELDQPWSHGSPSGDETPSSEKSAVHGACELSG